MGNIAYLQDRISAALKTLTDWTNGGFGLGGAAGWADAEQLDALQQMAWELEEIIKTYGAE